MTRETVSASFRCGLGEEESVLLAAQQKVALLSLGAKSSSSKLRLESEKTANSCELSGVAHVAFCQPESLTREVPTWCWKTDMSSRCVSVRGARCLTTQEPFYKQCSVQRTPRERLGRRGKMV